MDAKEQYQKCLESFDPSDMSKDSSRGFNLTSIKAQAIKQRMNEVFGIFGWRQDGEFKEGETGTMYIGYLEVYDADSSEWHKIHSIGFGKKTAKSIPGDVYKGAMTDHLSKAASNMGIGNAVFKGEVDPITLQEQAKKDFPKSGKVSSQKAGVQLGNSLEELYDAGTIPEDKKEEFFTKFNVTEWKDLDKTTANKIYNHYQVEVL